MLSLSTVTLPCMQTRVQAPFHFVATADSAGGGEIRGEGLSREVSLSISEAKGVSTVQAIRRARASRGGQLCSHHAQSFKVRSHLTQLGGDDQGTGADLSYGLQNNHKMFSE